VRRTIDAIHSIYEAQVSAGALGANDMVNPERSAFAWAIRQRETINMMGENLSALVEKLCLIENVLKTVELEFGERDLQETQTYLDREMETVNSSVEPLARVVSDRSLPGLIEPLSEAFHWVRADKRRFHLIVWLLGGAGVISVFGFGVEALNWIFL